MARVVHMTSVHPADDNRIAYKECRALAEHGHEVILIASRGETPQVPGVQVRRVPTPRSRLQRILRTVPGVLREALRADADLYHFHDPELLPVGLILKARGKRVVYDAHEDVPKQVRAKPYLAPSMRRFLPPLVNLVEQGMARALDGVVTATERVAEKFGRPRALAVHNFPRLGEFPADPPAYETRAPHMAYVGALDRPRGLDEMVSVARIVHDERPDARLIIAGRTSTTVARELEAEPAIDFRGFQTRQQVSEILQTIQIGLCILHPTPAYVEAIPTKVFEYMAAGNVTVCSDFPYWRELFEDAAIYVDPSRPDAIARAVLDLLDRPDRAAEIAATGQARARSQYNWDAEATKLVKFYEDRLAA